MSMNKRIGLLLLGLLMFCSVAFAKVEISYPNWFTLVDSTIVSLVQSGWSMVLSKFNGVIYVDGYVYPKTLSGVQSALNAAETAGGGVVEIMSNTTILLETNTSHVEVPSGVTLRGQGVTSIIKLADGVNPNWESTYQGLVQNKGWTEGTPCSDIVIENLKVDGNRTGNPDGQFNCISVGNGTNIIIRGCEITGASRRYTSGSYYQGCGIIAASLNSSLITGNHLAYNQYDGVRLETYGTEPEDGCRWVVVSNNTCRENGRNGIQQFGGYYNTIIGNTIYGGAGSTLSGITIDYGWDSIVIGNTVTGVTGSAGINMLSEIDNFTIADNIVSDITGSGIRVWCQSASVQPSDITITGNSVSRSTSDGIALEGSVGNINNTIITNNKLDSNGAYGIDVGNAIVNGVNLAGNTFTSNVTGTVKTTGAVGVTSDNRQAFVFIPSGEDIKMYIDSAPAGAYIKLQDGGSYTQSVSIAVAKPIVVDGGVNSTITYNTTGNGFFFNVSSSNVTIKNCNIIVNSSVSTGGVGAVKFLGAAGAYLTNCNVDNSIIAHNTSTQIGYNIQYSMASGKISNTKITLSSTAALSGYGVFCSLGSSATSDSTVDVNNVEFIGTTGAGSRCVGFATQDNLSSYKVYLNLYNSRATVSGSATSNYGALGFSGADAVLNLYDCKMNGSTADVASENDAVINLYGENLLVNGTMVGTLNRYGTSYLNNANLLGDLSLKKSTYSSIIKASTAEGLSGSDVRVGLDETLRMLWVGDIGDINLDGGYPNLTNPSILIASASAPTSYYLRIDHSGFSRYGGTTLGFLQFSDSLSDAFKFSQSSTSVELSGSDSFQSMIRVDSNVKQSGTAAFSGITHNIADAESFGDGTSGYGNNHVTLLTGTTLNAKIDKEGNYMTNSAGSFSIGELTADNSWRIAVVGGNLVFQHKESGSWVTKSTISA